MTVKSYCLWKKTFKTIHQLSCFVGHSVSFVWTLKKNLRAQEPPPKILNKKTFMALLIFLKGQIIQEGILIIKYLRFLDLLTTVNAVDLQNLKSPESR